MKTNRLMSASGALLSTALLIALAPAAHALSTPDFDYTVTLNVSSLSSNANGPFSLDLQLDQGSGNVANTVKIYNFSTSGTGGGFSTGTVSYSNGTESGTIGAGGIVTLNNTASDDELAATFAPGTQTISFNVDETPNAEVVGTGTPIPDQFNIAVLDGTTANIPTTDPSGGNTLVASPLGEDPSYSTYSSLSPDGGVTVVVATPEPNSGALSLVAAGGLLGLVLLRRRYMA